MTPARRRRLYGVAALVLGVAAATSLLLAAFRENLVYFHSPSEIAAGEAPGERKFRVGGLVEEGSVHRDPESLAVHFVLTDTAASVPVSYHGILPDLFREGQGIVANGQLNAEGEFVAAEVLAKHDENYMPAEVAEALERAGADAATLEAVQSTQ